MCTASGHILWGAEEGAGAGVQDDGHLPAVHLVGREAAGEFLRGVEVLQAPDVLPRVCSEKLPISGTNLRFSGICSEKRPKTGTKLPAVGKRRFAADGVVWPVWTININFSPSSDYTIFINKNT